MTLAIGLMSPGEPIYQRASHDHAYPSKGSAGRSIATVQDLRGSGELRGIDGIWGSRLDPGRNHPLLHLPIVRQNQQ